MKHWILILALALIGIESSDRDSAIGDHGKAWGPLQITQGVLDDVNRFDAWFLPRPFTRADCFDRNQAELIFELYESEYCTSARLGHEPTMRDAAMIWHWGPTRWNHFDSDGYWRRAAALTQ